jgi:very-short-patch-repair endonuclease
VSNTRKVIELARRNGGVISTHEALALGMSSTTLARRVDDGVFVRISRGMLALPGTATRPDLALRAAQRALGAVVSHESAARLHGFQPIHPGPPTVTVSHRGTHAFPGVIVHQATDLLDPHIETIKGLRVTTPERTIIDLAKVVTPKRLERLLDSALAGGKVELDGLALQFTTLTRKGKKGMVALRNVLSQRVGDDSVSETELERMLLQLLTGAGLPAPVRQFHAPWLQPINGRVDLAYPNKRIVIEGDGRRWHALFDAFETDRRRDNAAQLAGWMVLRFSWRMIANEPTSVVDIVRGALESRGA